MRKEFVCMQDNGLVILPNPQNILEERLSLNALVISFT